jgi:hypothetical protein
MQAARQSQNLALAGRHGNSSQICGYAFVRRPRKYIRIFSPFWQQGNFVFAIYLGFA